MNNQELAYKKLSKLKVGALFMEMGTGKTKVALDLMASRKNKIDYCLWICPYSLKNEIESEREKWHPELEIDVVGCESIGASANVFIDCLHKCENNKTFIVVDESLKIKNVKAKRTQRIIKLGELAEYKLILNGTPISKNVMDLWTQMNFLSPKILNMSYWQFKNVYCEYYIRGRLRGLVKKQHNVDHLTSLIKPYIFDAELDIEPKKRQIDIEYDLKDVEKYEALKNEFLAQYKTNFDFDFFGLATALQVCYISGLEQPLKDLLKKIKEKHVIVFVKFLKNIPENSLKVIGSMDSAQRKKVINEFKKNGGVLYMTYGCGAYGLNMQFCKTIVFAEHSFDYAQRIQAEARIYRMGQKEDVTYYNLWCKTGMERLIQASLNKKSNLLKDIKKEIDKKGIEWLKSI